MADTSKLKFTKTHEWVRLNDNIATVGISDHAQKEISDVVFVELPKKDRQVKREESLMVVESVKAAFDIYAPVSGKIIRVNEKLRNSPDLVNRSPYEEGWLVELECADPIELNLLMTETQYKSVENNPAH